MPEEFNVDKALERARLFDKSEAIHESNEPTLNERLIETYDNVIEMIELSDDPDTEFVEFITTLIKARRGLIGGKY